MTVVDVEEIPGLSLIDTKFNETAGHVGVYLLDAERPALIDTGASTGVDRILRGMETAGLHPDDIEFLLVSHVHLDHAGGAAFLLEACSNATLVCHPDAVPFLTDPDKVKQLEESAHRAVGPLAGAYGSLKPVETNRVESACDGNILDLGDRKLRVIETPGHSPNHLAFLNTRDEFLYVGDAAGMWIDDRVMPATPPPAFDFETAQESLAQLLIHDPKWLVYPHFGVRQEGNAALEAYADILDQWVKTIEEAYEDLGSRAAVVRAMTNRDLPHYSVWDEETARRTVKIDTMGVVLYLEQRE